MNNKKLYIPPTLTVVSVAVERGFAGSNQLFSLLPLFWTGNSTYNTQDQENWTEAGTLGNDWDW